MIVYLGVVASREIYMHIGIKGEEHQPMEGISSN